MSSILDVLPRDWRQPVGRVGAGFTIGMVTGVVSGFAPLLQEFVVEMKVPESAKRLGPAGIAKQMGMGGLSLGTFFGAYQVHGGSCRSGVGGGGRGGGGGG
jgi:hypothetical protein